METIDGMSKIYKHQQRMISSQLIIVAIGFSIFVLLLVGLHVNKEREVAYRIQTLELLDVAADDFGSGLLGLSMTPDSNPIRQAYYVDRIQSALYSFTTVSERLNNIDLRDKFRALLRDFQSELNDEDDSLQLNDEAYSFQAQVHLLERQLMRNLIKDRENQQLWFFVSLLGTILVMSFIILAMLRSEYRRNRVELQLRQSEGRFLELAERINEIFWLEDLQLKKLIYLSPAFERVYGRPVADVVKNTNSWFDSVHPDDKDTVSALREQSLYKPVVMEYRIVRPDGSVRWISDRVFPIHLERDDPNGKASRLAAVTSDITEHKELTQQLFVSQKMEALGQLTGGISHDFNNLLTVIMNNAELLAWQLADDDRLKRTAQLIIKASERGARLNQQLLAFARKQDLHPEIIEMRGLLEETVELLERTLPARILVNVDIDYDTAYLYVDAAQFQSALMNLCFNSRDAMSEGGELTISSTILTNSHCVEYLSISVSDTGHGIDETEINKVVEPFYTTKCSDKGTGLGLSMVYGFVTQSGGSLDIKSELGAGTRVHLTFPLSANTHQLLQATEPDEQLLSVDLHGKRILVVEDEELVLETTAKTLLRYGYDVATASTGAEALQLLQTDNQFDLVFSDVVMPGGVSGFDLKRHCDQFYPHLKVVLTSGYNDFNNPEAIDVLQKPYTQEQLSQVVHQQLAS